MDSGKQNIGQHIANLLKEKELTENSVVKNFFTTAADKKDLEELKRLENKINNVDGFEPSTICRRFKMEASDSKQRKTDCANPEGILCIIQPISSPKAEPFKRWLVKVTRRSDTVAGNARKDTEKELGRSIVTKENYLSDQLPDNEQNKLDSK